MSAAPTGAFERAPSAFRGWVGADVRHPVEAGRYHLYVCAACPWAHRTIIVRRLRGLEEAISLSFVDPIRDERGWAFTGGAFADPVCGFTLLSQAYAATDERFAGRVSVPVLWDRREGRIVNNESADIVRMLGSSDGAFAPLASGPDLYPPDLRADIDALNERIYETLNNGVYRAGFATTQEAYEAAVRPLTDTLDWLEGRLAARRYLAGDGTRITEADWRLFTTLARYDAVYHYHFKCNLRRVSDLPHLWAYARELYQWPGVAETVDFDQIRRHYYTTHPSVNPYGIVPAGPVLDWEAPPGRA